MATFSLSRLRGLPRFAVSTSAALFMGLVIAAPSPGAPDHRHGLLYSDKNDAVPPRCSRRFWLLQKSKKVWFRVDAHHRDRHRDSDRDRDSEAAFFYRGRRILYRGDLRALPAERRKTLEADSIVWGQSLAHGWGRGPNGTNHYLHLWTRWSILQPARCHPEYFTMAFLPPHQP
jgi:hypothetical protein